MNNEALSGGVMLTNSIETVLIKSSTFSNNYADKGGVFYFEKS